MIVSFTSALDFLVEALLMTDSTLEVETPVPSRSSDSVRGVETAVCGPPSNGRWSTSAMIYLLSKGPGSLQYDAYSTK